MDKFKEIRRKRVRKMAGLRRNLRGDASKPRLSVFRSNRFIYAQVIDDHKGHTLAASDSRKVQAVDGKDVPPGKKRLAYAVGKDIAQKVTALGIERVVFDRGWYRYHGRVKVLADAARQAGLKF